MLFSASLVLSGSGTGWAEERLPAIDVISTTPLHGVEIERNRLPMHTEIATDEEITRQQSLDLSEFLNQRFGSVFLNEAQNNPLQPDLLYRGFVASPLIGLPQGMSVYMDGVRINEPFGDTINWSVIPESAIAGVNLMAGSNPLFGLNTLGGALSVRTKNGFTHPGAEVEVSGGSFDRYTAQASIGGSRENLGYFITANVFDEEGWRDFSPSESKQLFGNLAWQGEAGSLDLTLSLSDSELIGNGALPEDLLEEDREAIFTRPDITEQDAALLRLGGQRALGDEIVLEGTIYYRNSRIDTLNGDDSDFEECEEAENEGFICEEEEGEEEEVVFDQDGNPILADDDVEGGTVNRSESDQDTFGLSLQTAFLQPLGGRDNQLIVGIAADRSEVDFNSNTELGSLDDSRKAIGSGIFVEESFTEVETETKNLSFYFTDTWSVNEQLALTLSGRWNKTEIELRDQLGTALNGDHSFTRFNPALGLTYDLNQGVNIYAGYSESSRAPTAMELTCADPEDPCRLPNAFLSDPPLEQVVAKTWEAGLRGSLPGLSWHVGLFQTTNQDDILFISAGALTNEGFFDNVGETRRQGLELSLNGNLADNRLDWFLSYTRLKATFEENLSIASPNNPFAVDGEIAVESGDRLPGLPENLLKAGLTYRVTPNFSLGADLQYSSDIVLRGDESNLDEEIDGYSVVNLRGEYQASDNLKLFAKVDNLFDREYETFGLYGEADEVLGDDYENPRFLSPGSPRAVWAGLSYKFY
ncbi:MAG: TonB-dependent receptor [Candidatus Thiodiazotropha sp. (ex Ctena orbiculata)]|nr:TonB-dependent receptor [Candidatus Thiodiazotropha taylori]MBT2996341.1 TonB-dependent receptor [Candidatus Thiodiazotropha taylori]MBT3000225.1 TonB-dependent receptor [Candidatus Thiodiazotropha taylori]MBV2106710.1 TonB-dependent receptor [Candidatus Thiodiazotropha taylori]MBV2110931.1 TonB-dependent receptor [Candidatus Thiodiazotropha taylori]